MRGPGLVLALCLSAAAARAQTPALGEPRQSGAIAEPAIHESSGVAASRVTPGALWTHNDSGDEARLFLLRQDGTLIGQVPIEATAHDWEDIASFEREGHPWLLVADTGDNKSKREHVTLYLIAEPPAPAAGHDQARLRPAHTLNVVYPGGPIDCEGVGVDVEAGLVLLVTKVRKGDGHPTVYTLPLAALFGEQRDAPLEAHPIAHIDVPQLTTALDVSPDGRTLIVLTYGDAYAWTRRADETWEHALTRAATRLPLPRREQGEALGFAADGRSIFLTSEGARSPIWVIPFQLH